MRVLADSVSPSDIVRSPEDFLCGSAYGGGARPGSGRGSEASCGLTFGRIAQLIGSPVAIDGNVGGPEPFAELRDSPGIAGNGLSGGGVRGADLGSLRIAVWLS